jgi:hypothetical protein
VKGKVVAPVIELMAVGIKANRPEKNDDKVKKK